MPREFPDRRCLNGRHGGLGFASHFALIASMLLLFLLSSVAASTDTSPLRAAARAGDDAGVLRLLEAGADPNEADDDGVTALHLAASEGHLAAARALVRHGAEINQAEFDGDTALVNASAFGHLEMVRFLLDQGSEFGIESSQGFTPIQLARRKGYSNIVKLLSKVARRPRSRASAQAISQDSIRRVLTGSARQNKKKYQPGYDRRIAAVIGINAYRNWPPLSGARADAEKIATKLKSMGFDEVLELYDREATRSAILDLLGTQLPTRVGEEDLVVIFFAGHGQTETIDPESGSKRGYIIPVDATIDGVFATAIPMPKLRELTNRLSAKHVYYAMDSCYSGLGFRRGLGFVKPTAKDYISKVTSLRAVQMVTAGGEGEEAIEQDGQGLFTRSFLAALDGAADANLDGFVTATEIGAYVAPRVTNESRAKQSPQSGRLEGEGEIAFDVRPTH